VNTLTIDDRTGEHVNDRW